MPRSACCRAPILADRDPQAAVGNAMPGLGSAPRRLVRRQRLLRADHRPYRLHRHRRMDRFPARRGLGAADQSRASDAPPRHRHRRAAPRVGDLIVGAARDGQRDGVRCAVAVVAAARRRRTSVAATIDDLVRAYPDALAGFDGTDLVWRDGTTMPVADGRPDKSMEEQLRNGSILDQLRLPYPAGAAPLLPAPTEDPGRVRNKAFFDKMYGDCRSGQVAPELVPVVWLPKTWGHVVRITSVNGVDRHACRSLTRAGRVARRRQEVSVSARRDLCMPVGRRHRSDQHACLGCGDRHQPGAF